MHTLKHVTLLIVLCQVVGNVVSQQPELVSFGDFMEFDIGFHKACENAPGGPNTTWPIVVSQIFNKLFYEMNYFNTKAHKISLVFHCRELSLNVHSISVQTNQGTISKVWHPCVKIVESTWLATTS